jgi:hypothetical protein
MENLSNLYQMHVMVTTPFLASLISKKIELKAYKAGHCLWDIFN